MGASRTELRVRGPEEALSAIRMSGLDPSSEHLAVICLQPDQRVALVVDIEGNRSKGWADSLEHVLVNAIPADGTSIVLVSCRVRGPTLPRSDELDAWRRLRSSLGEADIPLLDWLIVSGDRWRSLAEVDGEGA